MLAGISNLFIFPETELAASERTTQQNKEVKEVKDIKEMKQEPGPVTTTTSSSARPFDVSSLIKKEEADTKRPGRLKKGRRLPPGGEAGGSPHHRRGAHVRAYRYLQCGPE